MTERQPKELSILYIVAVALSVIIWHTTIALELKLISTIFLICMLLIFGRIVEWLESLRVKNP